MQQFFFSFYFHRMIQLMMGLSLVLKEQKELHSMVFFLKVFVDLSLVLKELKELHSMVFFSKVLEEMGCLKVLVGHLMEKVRHLMGFEMVFLKVFVGRVYLMEQKVHLKEQKVRLMEMVYVMEQRVLKVYEEHDVLQR